MRIRSASVVAGLLLLVAGACSSSSSDGASSSSIDAGIDASNVELCPSNLVLGEQLADDQYAAGICANEAQICTLSEALCPGHPATFLCQCEDAQWTCAISSGSYDACNIDDDGGAGDDDSSVADDDADAPLTDSGTDAADAADASDD
ncbi:MAG: hypothetical protein ABI551_04155 [Polyangiaceae bacterium]